MDRGQRSVVTGVHRLKHVERFLAANLTHDDAVGAHTQRIDHELPLTNGALAFDVGRARFEPGDVLLMELQLGGVLDRHDALARRDEAREHVQQRRLAGAGAAADEAVEVCAARSATGSRASACVSAPSVTRSSALRRSAGNRRIDSSGPSTASGGMMAFTREPSARRASTIGELSSTRRPIRLTMRSMTRSRWASSWNVAVTRSRTPLALDEHVAIRVDQNVADRRIAQQRLERTETEHVVEDLGEQRFPLRQAERRRFLRQQLREQRADFAFRFGTLDMRERFEVQSTEQLAMDAGAQLEILLSNRSPEPERQRQQCWGQQQRTHDRLPHRSQSLEAERRRV